MIGQKKYKKVSSRPWSIVTQSAIASCAAFFVLTTFWRRMWSITKQTHGNRNLFVKYTTLHWLLCSAVHARMTPIGPLHDPVTWHGINYTGTQITQWDFQNKGKSGWTGTNSFVLEVPLRNLRPSVIYSVPCDRIVQRAHWLQTAWQFAILTSL